MPSKEVEFPSVLNRRESPAEDFGLPSDSTCESKWRWEALPASLEGRFAPGLDFATAAERTEVLDGSHRDDRILAQGSG